MNLNGVSIIIPCWNREKFIGKAIESCLDQNIQNLEIIVVDDGSSDRSVDMIKSYKEKVRLIETHHQGACAARNIGWQNAKYSLIKFLDSDDLLIKNSLDKQKAFIESLSSEEINKGATVFGDVIIFSQGKRRFNSNSLVFPSDRNSQIEYLLFNNIQTSAPLHYKSSLERIGGFDNRLLRGQEWNFHLRLLASGVTFYYQPISVSEIIEHDGSERISNAKDIREGPSRFINFLTVEFPDLYGKTITAGIRSSIVKLLWRHGRHCVREGEVDVARELFAAAIAMNHNVLPLSVDRFYNYAVQIIGPVKTDIYRKYALSIIKFLLQLFRQK